MRKLFSADMFKLDIVVFLVAASLPQNSNCVATFLPMKTFYGTTLCALGLPFHSMPVEEVIGFESGAVPDSVRCAHQCSRMKSPLRCVGFNYVDPQQQQGTATSAAAAAAAVCDFFAASPETCSAQPGCIFYLVPTGVVIVSR